MPVCLSPLEAYGLWAVTWDDDPSPVVALESACLEPWFGDVRGKCVVDAGCGTGRWTGYLRSRGARVAGFDLSLPMLRRASTKPGLEGCLAAADLTALPAAPACADLVVCALSLGHVADSERALSELCRLVRPGGMLLLSDFHPAAYNRGWRRTFRHAGRTFEVEHHPWAIDELNGVASRAGLVLEELAEPGFGEAQREIFRRAGKDRLYLQVRGLPAVLAMRWRRPCS